MRTSSARPGNRARLTAAIAATALAIAGATACGSEDDEASAGSESGTATTAAGGGALEGKTIAFSPLNLQADLFVLMAKQFEQAVKAEGGKVLTLDPQGDAAKQQQQLQGVVQRDQVDGIFALPANPAALKSVVQMMKDKKIAAHLGPNPQAYGFDSIPGGMSFEDTDWGAYGKMAGEQVSKCIEERLGGTAQVAILGGPPLPGPVVVERIKQMKKAITDGSPGAKIVAEADGKSQKLESAQKMAAMLQAHKDINAVSGTSDDSILGAVQALRQAGKDPTEMCIVGLDGTPNGVKAVKDGTFYADVNLNFASLVEAAVKTLKEGIADPSRPGEQLTIPIDVITKENAQ